MLKNVHGPRSKEFQEIGDEVEDFARYLLSYSNDFSGIVSRRKFIKCIKRLTDKAIEYNAKKVSKILHIFISVLLKNKSNVKWVNSVFLPELKTRLK